MAVVVVVVAADGKVPPPPPPPPAPAPPAARGRRRLALAVGDAVLCLCLAKLWLFVAGKTAVDLVRVVGCGDGCSLLVSVAATVVSVCDWFSLETFGAIFLLFVSRVEDAASEEQVPVGNYGKKLKEAGREVMPAATLRAMTIGIIFVFLNLAIGDLLEACSPAKGSAMERIGSAFLVAWILGKDALCCIILPIVAVRLWRVTRPGWRCNAPAEIGKP